MIKLHLVAGLFCLCYFILPMRAQSSLALSSGSALQGASGPLSLSLTASAGNAPSAVEWTFAYPSSITGFTVSPGPVLVAAGKSINCAGTPSAYTCLASGLNSNAIGNGVAATISFDPAGVSNVSVSIPNAMAVSPAGASIAVSGSGAVFTDFEISGLQCVVAAKGDTCTVTLSAAAPAGGERIRLSSSNSSLSVPASVTIPSGATSISFAASAAPVAIAENVQITASLGSATATATVMLSPSMPSLFQLRGKATEVSSVRNNSTITPELAPAGLTGTTVVNGTGSIDFVSSQMANGVYFTNCCTNSNNAYYKFTGAAIGKIFNTKQGQISFTLQSRYSFAQRQASDATPRYVFDVRDGNGTHLFYFLTQVTGGYLFFMYEMAGSAQYYWAPQGTEDTLFGNGISLNVTLGWSSSGINLYLNGNLVRSTPYAASAPNWTNASNFDLGAYEYLNYGGFYGCDDVVGSFEVNAPTM
jgi:hypothetical protein